MSASTAAPPSSLSAVRQQIITCERCPRLRTYCRDVARTKKAAFRSEVYWARPVPGFGDPKARVLLLGLAPAAHGANRTGRVFTGDGVGASGDFLMAALNRAGFANIATSQRTDDGLALTWLGFHRTGIAVEHGWYLPCRSVTRRGGRTARLAHG